LNLFFDYSGLYLSFLIALVAVIVSGFQPSLDPLVISIITGMLISNILTKREFLGKGIDVMLSLFLPIGIGLYGSQLNLGDGISLSKWVIILTIFLCTFLLTVLLSKAFGLSKGLSILLASGLSICGASAIAIISPLIRAKREETSISLIVIMVIGLTAIIFYPLLYHLSGLRINDFTLLIGTTIPMLGQVKVTALQVAGIDALHDALRYKLIRVSMLFFLVIGVTFLFREDRKGFRLPWFMFLFIALAIIFNLVDSLSLLREKIQPWSSFLLSSGLAAIGLSIDFESIPTEGAKPLFAVLISWAIVLAGILIFLRILNVQG